MSIVAPSPVLGYPCKPSTSTLPCTPPRPPSRTERKFPCTHPGCGKAYFKPSRLAEHARTHTGERPHVCDCGQSYLRASHLAAHARTHKDESSKGFACSRCEKRFWTATHLRRHEALHDSAEQHTCTTCGAVFPKAHLLRQHNLAHLPAGSKPFPCTCGKSFATKQQLRTHERTHDPLRYTCSHPDHGLDLPTFPVWTALQAHMRAAHPPTCPHVECERRVFKSAQRLREHLRVHAEQEEDIANRGEEEEVPIVAEALGRRRRRDIEGIDTEPRARKLQRVETGEAGKDWTCGAPGCGRAFKSRFARDEHAQAAHSTGRHKCPICARAYRRPASLKRHMAGGWCGGGKAVEGEERGDKADGSEDKPNPKPKPQPDPLDLFVGSATAPGGSEYRRWACPYCPERFHRVYDVQRHLGSAHDTKLDDLGTRALLITSGQTGE